MGREKRRPRHICMIRPGIWADESFNQLSCRARLLWLGLAGFLDCEGRGVYEPARLAGEVFGEDVADYGALFAELRDRGMIELYAVAEVTYMQITDFARHQRVDRRRVSRLPARPRARHQVARRPDVVRADMAPPDMARLAGHRLLGAGSGPSPLVLARAVRAMAPPGRAGSGPPEGA